MKNQEETSTWKISGWIGFIFAAGVLVFNMYLALWVSPSIPVVDGWAVLNRIIHFDLGEMGWSEYLFRPHGAHLHFIVYLIAWLDYHFASGQEKLTQIVSLGATAVYCAFLVSLVVREALRNKVSTVGLILAASATAAIVTGISDHETMLHPFQVVLSAARLSYILLLWLLIRALIENNAKHYFIIIAISMFAVTFHGTGYVFAVCMILTHILVCRNRWWMTLSVLPLLSAILIQSHFSPGGGELSSLGNVLNLKGLFAFFPSVSAFFAVPFGHLMPMVGVRALLVLGFILFLFTTVLTFVTCLRILGIRSIQPAIWWAEMRQKRANGVYNQELVLFAIMGLFVLMSAFAAALFWIVRTTDSSFYNTPYRNIFAATRYGATASLAYVMLIVFLLSHAFTTNAKDRSFNFRHSLSSTAIFLILLMGIWTSIITLRVYKFDDQLNIAVAGISLGLSPVQPEAEAIWPSAKDDPYWANELPFTVRTMRAERKGPWHNLPTIGARGGAFYAGYLIEHVVRRPITSDSSSGRCSFSGTITSKTVSFPKTSLMLPISTAQGVVIGYAALTRQSANLPDREVSGFVLCPDGVADVGSLFVSRDIDRSVETPLKNMTLNLQGFGTKAIAPLSVMKGSFDCKVEPGASEVPTLSDKVVLEVRNLSNFDWKFNEGKYPLRIGIHYQKPDGTSLQWDNGFRVATDAYIPSGGIAQIQFPLTSLNLSSVDLNQRDIVAEFGLVQEGIAWFNNITCKVPVKR